MLTVSLEASRNEVELDAIRAGMQQHTERQVPFERYQEVTVVLRDGQGRFLGAALGETGRGWLRVAVLWVDEAVRGRGHGRRLMEAIGAEAVERGCQGAFLDTYSYQARPFYERLGYTVFGALEDYPPGHTRYFMQKRRV